MWEVIKDLSKWRDDLFFYLFYPHEVVGDEYEMEFLKRYEDRVTLIPVHAITSDRKRSFWSLESDVYEFVAPGIHPGWDAEIIITSRIPQIPAYKHISGKAGAWSQNLPRAVIGLEEMPQFSWRDTTTAHEEQFDLTTYSAYRLSDGLVFNNLWTKKLVMKEGRKHLSPGHLLSMEKKLFEAVPVPLEPLHLRSNPYEGGDFNVVFTGRMTATRSFDKVLRLFTQSFVYDIGGKKEHVRYIISTNSRSSSIDSPTVSEYVDVQMNDRAKFHALLKNKAHVVVNLSKVEDFSLSTYEPLLFGVPVIVSNEPWTGFLGPDYPFRVDSPVEAYALLKRFIADYDAQYEKFRAWEATTWHSVIASSANTTTSEHLKRLLLACEDEINTWFTSSSNGSSEFRGGAYHDVAIQLMEGNPKQIDLTAHFSDQYDEINLRRVAIGKRPTFLMLKRILMLHGYKDTHRLGVLEKSNP